MTYLSTAEVAEIKGYTPQYIRRMCQKGEITCETADKAANNRIEYRVPLSALSESEQIAYENKQRHSLGLEPVKKAVKQQLSPAEKPRLTLDDLTDKQRTELYVWTSIIHDWLEIREKYPQYTKGEVDEMFVQAARLKYPNLDISTDILYRRLKAYRNSDISGLIDKRGGKNKGTTVVPEFMLNAFCRLYLDQQCLTVTCCYKFTQDWVKEHYPESFGDMPSERTFRRRAEDIPYAVKMYFRYGDKAFSDKCLPYIERLYDDLHANDVWIADNHTFDFFTIGKDGKTRRLYLTAFTDAKSGVMVGWNLTFAPSGDSTLLALRHGILRCGVPKAVYFDNGSEFLVSDIGGRGHRRKKDWNKDPLPPNILQFLGIEMADLKRVYQAVDEQSALASLDDFAAVWDKKYPKISKSWRENWANLSTYFKFPEELRRLIYTTNAIEGFNRQLRKVTKSKSVFPTDDSLFKMLYLAMLDITKKWTGRRQDWGQIYPQLALYYGDRITD